MAKKKIHVRWALEVLETYEADIELDENEIPEDFEYDEQSYILLERLPALEEAANLKSNSVLERDIDVFEVQ